MNLNIQFQLKANPNYQRYLRENSYWYKVLNRNPELFSSFIEQMKETYKLTMTDRFTDVLDRINLINNFIRIINQ